MIWLISGIGIGGALLVVAAFILQRTLASQPNKLDDEQIVTATPAQLVPSPEPASNPEPTEAVQATPTPEPKVEPTEAQKSIAIADLLEQYQILQREDIQHRVEAALELVNKTGSGHIVVGQLKMLGGASPRDVISQVEILDDGYFVEPVAVASIPLHFWHPEYDRLSLQPSKTNGPIENVGEISMRPSQAEGGSVRGVAVANGSEVPQELKIDIRYEIPTINRCAANPAMQALIEKAVVERLQALKPPQIEITAESGAFKISNLPNLRCEIRFSTSKNDSGQFTVEIGPGEHLSVYERQLYRADPAQLGDLDLKETPWAPDGKPLVETFLANLPDARVLAYFQERYPEGLKEVERFRASGDLRKAVLIVGQIKIPGREFNGEEVSAQMRLSPGGYFCEAVRPGAPIGFRLHGYEPLDYVPVGSNDGVEHCGVLAMRKTKPTEASSLAGTFLIEGNARPADLRIGSWAETENINRPDNSVGTEGGGSNSPTPQVIVSANRFQFRQLSPIGYSFSISGTGLVRQFRTVQFEHGEKRTMPPFYVFRQREIRITSMTSKDGNFGSAIPRSTTTNVNDTFWRSIEDMAVYHNYACDFILKQFGSTVFGRFFYSPCYLYDLGVHASVEAFRDLDVSLLKQRIDNSVSEYAFRPGHIYLLNQKTFNHWVIFRVDSIDLAPLEK